MFNRILKATLLVASLLLVVSCGDEEDPMTGGGNMGGNTGEFTVYTGDKITFTKADDTDPAEEANQDRINDNVWITRGTSGGEIYNAKTESASTKGTSPAGTEWAVGKTSNIDNLTFSSFRDAIKPQDVVGKDLVLHLIGADEYLDVKFTAWTEGKAGGFAYERRTK